MAERSQRTTISYRRLIFTSGYVASRYNHQATRKCTNTKMHSSPIKHSCFCFIFSNILSQLLPISRYQMIMAVIPPSPSPKPTLLSLPTRKLPTPMLRHLPLELHLLIYSNLSWPDLLALKHTHPYFYHNIPTTVRQRVTWLLSRAPFGLGFPQEKVNMKTDADFCRSLEIRKFLERRRWHLDCQCGGKSCLVFEGGSCPVDVIEAMKGKSMVAMKRNHRRFPQDEGKFLRLSLGFWWVLVLLVAVLVALMLSDTGTTSDSYLGAKSWFRAFARR
jgi:hypothetical protein